MLISIDLVMDDGCENMISMLEQQLMALKIHLGPRNVGCFNDFGLVA